jgi:hypothetical protein
MNKLDLNEQLSAAKEKLRIAKQNLDFEEQQIQQEKINTIKLELQRHLILRFIKKNESADK